jgi:acetyl-CoA synthetase
MPEVPISAEPGSSSRWAPIAPRLVRPPHLDNYERTCKSFSWQHLQETLVDRADSRMNMAQIVIDRHAAAIPDVLAVRFIDALDRRLDLTYAQLQKQANQFANALAGRGVGRGAVVASLLGRCPELFVTVLGTLKCGAAYTPLFSAFGPEPIRTRLTLGKASVLVTTARLYERKIAPIRSVLPDLRHVFIVREDGPNIGEAGTVHFDDAVASQSDTFDTVMMDPDELALLHFTSGTTGKPKGVTHAHRAVIAHYATGHLALDLHPGDVYWCTADPGWVTGISYGVVAPLACGVTTIVDREDMDVERWYKLLAEEKISVWYTAPTAIRLLMRAGMQPVRMHQYPALRFIASVGEPLNPEAVTWGQAAFGFPIHDTWWQTETGAIMIANFAAEEVCPGSMGRPLPGIEAAIAKRNADGSIGILADGEIGEIALRPGWPSMFTGYLGEEERYRKTFAGDWYFSGDQATRDAKGRYWFVGRIDDVIKSSGHLISPFEVECAVNLHPAVLQSAVIGLPDAVMGQMVRAIVELRPGHEPTAALQRDILAHARRLLGAAIAPREIAFEQRLPRTRSGKILRRLLRARALGLPEGDLSTLEGDAA